MDKDRRFKRQEPSRRMTDEEIIEAMRRQIQAVKLDGQRQLLTDEYAAEMAVSSYFIAKREIERRLVEELMNPDMEAKMAGASAVQAHMRGPREPGHYTAAIDAWFSMLCASPFYARARLQARGDGSDDA